jgi:hypothetical protein
MSMTIRQLRVIDKTYHDVCCGWQLLVDSVEKFVAEAAVVVMSRYSPGRISAKRLEAFIEIDLP